MKIITIKQPVATLIAEGLKEFEFCTFKTQFRRNTLIHTDIDIDKKTMERCKDLNLNNHSEGIVILCMKNI